MKKVHFDLVGCRNRIKAICQKKVGLNKNVLARTAPITARVPGAPSSAVPGAIPRPPPGSDERAVPLPMSGALPRPPSEAFPGAVPLSVSGANGALQRAFYPN